MGESELKKAVLYFDDINNMVVINCHYLERDNKLKLTKGKYYDLIFKDTILAVNVFSLLIETYPEAEFSNQFSMADRKSFKTTQELEKELHIYQKALNAVCEYIYMKGKKLVPRLHLENSSGYWLNKAQEEIK